MRFPPTFLDDIRARIPISAVVGRRVSWDKRKSQPQRGDHWACCPFHGEKTPSFHAEDRKGRYHCFGCGTSGDHFTFLVEAEGLSFPEAVAQLAAEAGLPMPERSRGDDVREAQRASLYDVLESAARFFESALQGPDGAKARAYVRERGLSPETQKRFRIGYAPASRKALKEHLAAAGIPQEQMIEAGLLIAGDDIPVSYDRFRDRVIFPIIDLRGRVIAFGGRALAADAQAKYLNSPETPLFHKGTMLFNGKTARAAARSAPVIAVEGYIDVIACVAAGFEATVAPLGTALTEDQLRLLWQMADEPILCFDGDDAGLKAAFRAIETALPHLKPAKSLRFALLPEGQDPDDLIRKEGPEAFRKVLAGALPMIEMLWQREIRGQAFDTPERRAGLEQALRSATAAIADQSVRRHYEIAVRDRIDAQFGARRFARPRGSGRPGARGTGARGSGQRRPEEDATPSSSLLSNPLVRQNAGAGDRPTMSDAVLIGTLLCHPEIAGERLEQLAHCRFSSPGLARLAAALGLVLAEDPDVDASGLAERLHGGGHGKAVEAVLGKMRQAGLAAIGPGGDSERAAAIWDDAAHLRLRAGALSIERQAAAMALGRDASDFHLIRLRDIQEQDQRTLRPEGRDGSEDAVIVHPFKGR
jgi:DNA primase